MEILCAGISDSSPVAQPRHTGQILRKWPSFSIPVACAFYCCLIFLSHFRLEDTSYLCYSLCVCQEVFVLSCTRSTTGFESLREACHRPHHVVHFDQVCRVQHCIVLIWVETVTSFRI